MNETVEVLGCRLKLKAQEENSVKALDVIELINSEANIIKKHQPEISNQDLAVMVALKIAADKLALEKEYRTNIEYLEETVDLGLKSIDKLTPPPTPPLN